MPTAVELVTPERVLFSGDAGFVVLRTDGGEIMFLPEHAPFIAAVDICVVRIDAGGGPPGGADAGGGAAGGGGRAAGGGGRGGEVRAAVAGGFVHVAGNRVTVLAGVAELAEEIDVERARRAFDAASAEAGSGGGGEAAMSGRDSAAGRESGETRSEAAGATSLSGAGTAAGAAGAGEEPREEEIAQTPTMRALTFPDEPDVRARRAANRLAAAGEADQNVADVAAGAAPAAAS